MGSRTTNYDIVADALLWTLDKGLGADFTPDVREEWISVYTTLADTMKSAEALPECSLVRHPGLA
jgi:hemoglobin-like flavoprotein